MRWCFQRRRDVAGARELMAAMQWEADMCAAGWRQWVHFPPARQFPEHEVVEVKRREWPMIQIWRVSEVEPATNAAGLWWQPTRELPGPGGIIELEKTPLGYI